MKALKYMMMGMLVSLTPPVAMTGLMLNPVQRFRLKPPYRIWMMWNIA